MSWRAKRRFVVWFRTDCESFRCQSTPDRIKTALIQGLIGKAFAAVASKSLKDAFTSGVTANKHHPAGTMRVNLETTQINAAIAQHLLKVIADDIGT